jgi:hypothetical protein
MRPKDKARAMLLRRIKASENGKISAYELAKIIPTTQGSVYKAMILVDVKPQIDEYRGKMRLLLDYNQCERILNYFHRKKRGSLLTK